MSIRLCMYFRIGSAAVYRHASLHLVIDSCANAAGFHCYSLWVLRRTPAGEAREVRGRGIGILFLVFYKQIVILRELLTGKY